MKLAEKVVLNSHKFTLSEIALGSRKDLTVSITQTITGLLIELDHRILLRFNGEGVLSFERVDGEDRMFMQRDLTTKEIRYSVDRPVPTLTNTELVKIDTGLGSHL